MNFDLAARLDDALRSANKDGVSLTPQAVTLLTVMIDSIADAGPGSIRAGVAEAQLAAIGRVAQSVKSIANAAGTQRITALLVLRAIPRDISELVSQFCPFE